MTYSSKNRLPLSEKPQSQDEGVFPDLLDLYNSVHLLNQKVTMTAEGLTSGEDYKDPNEAITFRNWFWTTAGEPLPKGTIVTPLPAGRYSDKDGDSINLISGVYKGCGVARANQYHTYQPNQYPGVNFHGFALDEAVNPGDIIRVGIGPVILELEGIKPGNVVYCGPILELSEEMQGQVGFVVSNKLFENRGGLTNKAYNGFYPIGFGVQEGYVLFNSYVDDFTFRINNALAVQTGPNN